MTLQQALAAAFKATKGEAVKHDGRKFKIVKR